MFRFGSVARTPRRTGPSPWSKVQGPEENASARLRGMPCVRSSWRGVQALRSRLPAAAFVRRSMNFQIVRKRQLWKVSGRTSPARSGRRMRADRLTNRAGVDRKHDGLFGSRDETNNGPKLDREARSLPAPLGSAACSTTSPRSTNPAGKLHLPAARALARAVPVALSRLAQHHRDRDLRIEIGHRSTCWQTGRNLPSTNRSSVTCPQLWQKSVISRLSG